MASTARAYPNTARGNSAFSLPDLVAASNWPPTYRDVLLTLLSRNQFGTELWLSTKNIAIEVGVSYSTVKRMLDRLEKGHTFGGGNRKLVRCDGVLELTLEANSRPHGELRRSRTYRLRSNGLKPRPTRKQLDESSRGAVCPLPPQPERPRPPASATPAAAAPAPQHRGTARPKPAITQREMAKIAVEIAQCMKGRTHTRPPEGGLGSQLSPGDPGYRAPMTYHEAIRAVAAAWKRTPDVILEAVKGWGYQFPEDDESPGGPP